MSKIARAGLVGLALVFSAAASEESASKGKRSGKGKVLVFYGVYTQHYRLDEALARYDLKISNAHSRRADHFPPPRELLATKLIILSDVSGGEFTLDWVRQIKSYVKEGGSLLVLGGPFTLGLGRFAEQGIAEVLPVELEAFDLKWEKDGVAFDRAAEHPAVRGLDLHKRPMVYWIHRVRPKKNAQVVLKAGSYPLLVAGVYGKGKVMVFTGTPMGRPAGDHVPFWEWDGWTGLVQRIADWLTTKEGK